MQPDATPTTKPRPTPNAVRAPHRFAHLTAAARDVLTRHFSPDVAFFFARAPELDSARDEAVALLTETLDRIPEGANDDADELRARIRAFLGRAPRDPA